MTSKAFVKDNLKQEKLFVIILASIQFSHIVDFVVLMPLGPILMREFSISPMQFGGLVSSYNISAAISGFLYGLIADRFGRKIILIFNFIGFIIGTLICSYADSYEFLLTARIIAGAFGGTLTAVVFAMVTDLIPFQRRGRAMSAIMSAFSVASVIGVPLGLLIAETYSWRSTFIFIVLISVISLTLSVMIFPKLNEHTHKSSPIEVLKRLFSLLFKWDYLKSYGVIFANAFALFSIIPYLSPFAVKNIGIQETDLKYMYFVAGIFTVITARIIGKLTDHKNPFIIFSVIALTSLIPIYLYTSSGPLSLTMFITISTFFMVFVSGHGIPLMTLVSEIPDNRDRGTFMGLINSVRALGSAMATLYAGFIITENANKLQNFEFVGYSSILITILLLPMLKHIYNLMLERKNERDSTT